MARKKQIKASDKLATLLNDAFAELSVNNLWITKTSKDDTDIYENVASDLDLDALDEAFDDNHFFNLWIDVEDIEDEDLMDIVNTVASEFYGSNYYMGTKYPYLSKDGTKVSFRILER